MSVNQEQVIVNEYKLHYVGGALYSAKRFIREAQRIGVNRTLTLNYVENLKWGEKILLGERIADGESKEKRGEIFTKKARAAVFGYFPVQNLSYDMPKEVRELFLELLNKKGSIGEVHNEKNPIKVERACGAYVVISVISVSSDIKELIETIKEATGILNKRVKCKTCGLVYPNKEAAKDDHRKDNEKYHPLDDKTVSHYLPQSFKYFVGGRIFPFKAPLILEGAEFRRGLLPVRIAQDRIMIGPDEIQEQRKSPTTVTFVKDYKRRMYIPKKEKEKMDQAVASEFEDTLKGVNGE